MKSDLIYPAQVAPADKEQLREYVVKLAAQIGQQFTMLNGIINGGLTFGDGTTLDNLAGAFVDVTTHATPGTEFSVTHNMGVVPIGFLLLIPPVAGVVNKGATAWTTTTLYLTCTGASQAIRIFALPPPVTLGL